MLVLRKGVYNHIYFFQIGYCNVILDMLTLRSRCVTYVNKMKVANSLKTLKNRHKACKLVRRKGRVYVINKRVPKFKARQG